MQRSEDIKEIAIALSKAQAVMHGAAKDAANPFFKSNYATLASVWDAAREPLTANGLAIVQTMLTGEHGVEMETTLMHSSGQWMSSYLPVRPTKDDPQGMGSAITYARRYSLAAMVGIAPEDDDGNAASRPSGNGKARTAAKPEAKASKMTDDPDRSATAESGGAPSRGNGAGEGADSQPHSGWSDNAIPQPSGAGQTATAWKQFATLLNRNIQAALHDHDVDLARFNEWLQKHEVALTELGDVSVEARDFLDEQITLMQSNLSQKAAA